LPVSPLPLPGSFPSGLPRVRFLEWETSLWRIQDSDCLAYKTYPGPKYRFDAPAGQYAIIYTNSTEHGPFAENYAELDRYIGKENADRYLVKITPRRPLPLVDLRSTDTLSTLRLDHRISTTDVYDTCQRWALAFHRAWHDICGICYQPRKAAEESSNVAIFATRSASKLVCSPLGQLKELEEKVLSAGTKYKLTADIEFI
jgi:RES domain